MEDILVPILVPLITFSFPILFFWLYYRNEMHQANKRTEIILAAIEKNPDVDIAEFLQKMNPKQKLLKEKLLSRLLWGCITGFIGLGLLIGSVFVCYAGGWHSDEINFMWITGAILLAIGIAFFVNYHVGKKMLAKEMEAETNNMNKR